MNEAFKNASADFRRLNPELFGLGPVQSPKSQPHEGRALDPGTPQVKSSRSRMASGGPVLRVTLISVRNRLIDDSGNLPSGFKELQDAIARFFDLDDEDGTIDWQYRQVETRGEQGTIVRIEVLN